MAKQDENDEIEALMKELNETPDEDTGAGPQVEIEQAEPDQEPAEPQAAAPEAEQSAADAQPKPEQEPAADKEQRMVPHQAMHKERARAQEAERKIAEIEAQREKDRQEWAEQFGQVKAYREQLEAEQTRRQQQEAEAAAPKKLEHVAVPDWDDDPRGHTDAMNRNSAIDRHNLEIDLTERARAEASAALEEKMKPINSAYEQHQKTVEDQTREHQLVDTVGRHEQAFVLENADYYDAVQAYKSARFEDFQALGLQPVQAVRAVENEMKAQAHQFLEARMDPAASWYNLAKRRGFGEPQQQNGALNGNADPEQKQAARPAGKPSVETMQRGMAASDGLANVSQAGGSATPSAEAALDKLLDLPESEIAKRLEDIDKLSRKVFG